MGETEFVQGIAARSASGQYGMTTVAAGIVGFADLTLGTAVVPVLEAQLAASRNRFRGIRHTCAWDASADIASYRSPPKGLLLDPKFREGFACLQKYSLSFDAWLYHPQLTDLADLARVFPDIPIIVNHIGGPLGIGPYAGKREEIFQEWKRSITALATCPNGVVILGGLGVRSAEGRGGWCSMRRPVRKRPACPGTAAGVRRRVQAGTPCRECAVHSLQACDLR